VKKKMQTLSMTAPTEQQLCEMEMGQSGRGVGLTAAVESSVVIA
jgi:hypothetical protein